MFSCLPATLEIVGSDMTPGCRWIDHQKGLPHLGQKKSTSTKERHGQRTTSDRVPTRKSYWCWEPPRFQQILNGGYLLHHHRGKQLGSLWLFKGVLEGMWDYASQCGCFVIKFMEDSCKSSLKPIFCFHVFNQSYLSTQDAWGTCFLTGWWMFTETRLAGNPVADNKFEICGFVPLFRSCMRHGHTTSCPTVVAKSKASKT